MQKKPVPLVVGDVSRFARNLAGQLKAIEGTPSHLALLNIIARASGYRNYQHLTASRQAQERLLRQAPPESVDFRLLERTLNQYCAEGKLARWPSRRAVQEICLWHLWTTLPTGRSMTEKEVNTHLNSAHRFNDAAILRRSLVGMGLVSRDADGSNYQRIKATPPPTAQALIKAITPRRG